MTKFGTPILELMKNPEKKKFELVNLGKSGCGKTTRSLTATCFGPVYLLDFDGKVQGSIRKIPEAVKADVDLSKLMVENCRDWDYEKLKNHINDMIRQKDSLPMATIVIDTFTNFSEIIYESIFPTEADLFKSNAMQMWGKVSHRTKQVFAALQSLPCNLVINCHTKEDEAGNVIGPQGKGGFRDLIQARVTDMHYIQLKLGKHKVKVSNSETPPVNTNLAAEHIDEKGFAKSFSLSILKDYAYTLNKSVDNKPK